MTPPDLVTTDWLSEHLNDANLVVLHASYFLGNPDFDPKDNYARGHIPGARLFEIDEVCDQTSPLPHMLPTGEAFSKAASALGISNASQVVVYDDGGVRPSFRVWWTFKVFGLDTVSVLDGGLMKWAAETRTITPESPKINPGQFQAKKNQNMVASKERVMANIEFQDCEVLDARGPGRFSGTEADPRPGIKSGHIPGSKNLFFRSLFNEDATLKEPSDLAAKVENLDLDPGKPIINSCGSGVTASILYFVLNSLGHKNLKVYDGSWAEWGRAPDTPVATSKG